MSYLVEFSMTPIGKGESVSRQVARCVGIVARSRLPYRMGPMGTSFEAPTLRRAHAVIEACERALRKDCRRISILVKIDARRGASGRLTGKIESVRRRLSPGRR